MRARTSLALLLGFGDGVGVGDGRPTGGEFFHRAVQFLAAGFVEELQLGLFAHQFDFDLGALFVAFPAPARVAILSSSSAAREGFAHGGVVRRPSG